MKTLFYTALTFALMLSVMGIFFGYVIYIGGKELREINTEFLFILGAFGVSSIGAIIIGTPIINPHFWSTIKEHRDAIIKLNEETDRLAKIRNRYEQQIASSPTKEN